MVDNTAAVLRRRSEHRDTGHRDDTGMINTMEKFNFRGIFTWKLAKTLAMGQGLAVFICGTAITSQYLASDYHVNTPMLQSFLNYVLLCVTYTPMLLFRTGDGHMLQILKQRGWKYVLLGLVDVEANYAVVKAYQYTTLTSVQLLDCFIIPVLMVLSWWILKTRYRPVHYVAVAICLLGVGAMVGADLLAGRDQGSTSNILLGDGLVLVSATLYAISNVCQEYTVKNLSRVEVILERHELASIQWSWQIGLLFAAYALCMYTLYSCMPVVVKLTSATSVNLSLLTADLISLFCGLFLFHYSFSPLYLISLVAILVGFVTFNAVPTPTNSPSPLSPITGEGGCYDNPAIDFGGDEDGIDKQEVAVTIVVPTEKGQRREGDKDPRAEMEARTRGKGHVPDVGYGSFSDVVCSTKM
ncbi:hypothetical protein NHX12_008197 [Muraenolepis orangiensis]|uniref:Solute carrier family 35 member F2 n=1 Tax=Muraenolepis orangiensis TaxID=630683 RepID=A0A9Q0DKW3_9TELE|nr:hypothetical protein NHX12_008197 [Muraenolepis orangiensis]